MARGQCRAPSLIQRKFLHGNRHRQPKVRRYHCVMAAADDFHDYWPDDIKGLTVVDGHFVVTTADGADRPDDAPVLDVLQRVRDGVGMDIVFISQFTGADRVIRHVSAKNPATAGINPGDRDPLEETFCKQVVDGRRPPLVAEFPAGPVKSRRAGRAPVGAYVIVPITAPDGAVFGTLCCVSEEARPKLGARSELQAVRAVAELLSSALRPGS